MLLLLVNPHTELLLLDKLWHLQCRLVLLLHKQFKLEDNFDKKDIYVILIRSVVNIAVRNWLAWKYRLVGWLVNGVQRHFQQYFSYIEVVSFIGGGNRIPVENHWPAASHWQTLSHNVVLSTPCHERVSNSQF